MGIGISLNMSVIIMGGYYFTQFSQNIRLNIGVGVFIDCNAGSSMGTEYCTDTMLNIIIPDKVSDMLCDILKFTAMFRNNLNFNHWTAPYVLRSFFRADGNRTLFSISL